MIRIVNSTRKKVELSLRRVLSDSKEVVLCTMCFDLPSADLHVVWTVDAHDVPFYVRISEIFKFLKLVKSLNHE